MKIKNQNVKFLILSCNFTFYILHFTLTCFAQETNKLSSLTRQIIEAKTDEELYAPFEGLKEAYFKDNKYSEFVDFLKSLSQKKTAIGPFINYYIALTRLHQLRYLEEKQIWDTYFNKGNVFRNELFNAGQKAKDTADPASPIGLYARSVLWQFHKYEQDGLDDAALVELADSAFVYAKTGADPKPIKVVADNLKSFGEKIRARQLYMLYVQRLASSGINNEALSGIASGIYEEGNLELSELIFDVYIERVTKTLPKEKSAPILLNIAGLYSYKDKGRTDPFYAEKIFKKLEEVGGKEGFSQESVYLRAFNLERSKEYQEAKDFYVELNRRFPANPHFDEANFKAGIIYTYILRDINSGRLYFESLIKQKTAPTPQKISGFYQLGLLSQWQNDFNSAKEYYTTLLDAAKDNYKEIVGLTRERQREIEQARPLEYNLKVFLDTALKEEYKSFDMQRIDLRAYPYKVKKQEDVLIKSTALTNDSGCMQIELQYLWSGNLGLKEPDSNYASFDTAYAQEGTKEINLVVVSPNGILDYSLDMLDVY